MYKGIAVIFTPYQKLTEYWDGRMETQRYERLVVQTQNFPQYNPRLILGFYNTEASSSLSLGPAIFFQATAHC